MTLIAEQVGLRLTVARKASGYKKASEFAAQYKIPKTTYSQHETGKRCLNAEQLIYYGNILETEPSWLLTGKGHPCPGSTDKNKANFMLEEVEKLRSEGKLPIDTYPALTSDNSNAAINMILFSDIIGEVIPLIMEKQLNLNYSELINFCIDIYNSVITLPNDAKVRHSIIQLSVKSLLKGTSDIIQYNKGKLINIG